MLADRRFYSLAFLATSLVILPTALGQAQSQTEVAGFSVIQQINVSQEREQTVVRISGEGSLVLQTERLDDPERLVLDFTNARLDAARPAATGPVGPVRGIRLGQFKADVARVVIDLEGAAPYHIETGARSVTVVFGAQSPNEARARPAQRSQPSSPAAVVTEESATHPTRSNPAPSKLKAAMAGPASSSPVVAGIAPATPTEPQGLSPSAAPLADNASVFQNSFQNGVLTFRAKDQSLQSVLSEIGDLTNLPIVVANGVGNEHISATFRSYRVDEALRQMLKDYDVLFSYGSDNDSPGNPTLRTVWVYPPNHGPGTNRFALATWIKTARQYEQTLASSDPNERARAVDELIRRDGRDAVNVVLDALKDPSDKVRYQALYRAVLVGALPSEDTMIDLVLNDESGQVRVWAFQTLPLDPTLRWVAQRALNDPDQQVTDLARNYLKDLDESTGAPAPQVAIQSTTQPNP